jgi:dolichol-phosphate mannosyltransferase
MALFIILPSYNEERALRRLVPDLAAALRPLRIPFTICIVDDGSTDHTTALIEGWQNEYPLQHLRHDENRGYGAALKTGYYWVSEHAQPEDIAISLDADNTHPPSNIPALVKKVEAGFDAVTATYSRDGGRAVGVPRKRKLLSLLANALLRMRFRIPGAYSYTNGFRAYRVKAVQKGFEIYGNRLIEEMNFAGGTEMFIKIARQGNRAGEIPFVLHYENRGNDSKINLARTVAGYLKLLLI